MRAADSGRHRARQHPVLHTFGAWALALLLAACGGGGGNSENESASGSSGPPLSRNEAARFLSQASYGANDAAITGVTQQGYAGWLDAQFARPQRLHRTHVEQMAAANDGKASQNHFFESFWTQAVTGDDQLRQRVAFALSQIFVVSFADGTLGNMPRGVASYYDMLGERGFGNYRDLLEGVALHPAMGIYLSHMRNQKEDPVSGRVPDENFAREVMQLFSIGLYELNPDGTPRLDAGGNLIETYGNADIQGLAKVFTGWSWYAGSNTSDRTRGRFFGNDKHLDRDWRPMQAYNKYASNTDFHSGSEKKFLGVTIPAQSTPDPEGDLKIALDTLFDHPNVGPFIGRQLIQRLVTSNPSPAYVARVAAAFDDNGKGVRGDMKAVIAAVLLDPQARSRDAASTTDGKLREPVVRLAHWMRAFKASSVSGRFLGIDNTDDPASRLGQSPMRAGSVFNFYRPGYAPPNTAIANAGLVAPELQIAHEVSVAGYLNYMRGWVTVNTTRDVRQDYSAEIALADDVPALVDRIDQLLLSGQMSDALRTQITAAVVGRVVPQPTTDGSGAATNRTAIDAARRDRACIAIFLAMASPDYLTQK